MRKRVAIYARVSTGGQSVECQLPPLREWAGAAGHELVGEFVAAPVSGGKARDKRPGLDRLMKAVARREVDVVACVAIDRLARSMTHFVHVCEELRAVGVGLFVRNLGLDSSTPAGALQLNMVAAFAEFERALIVERTHAGLARARREGKVLGAPALSPWKERDIAKLLRAGTSVAEAARRVGVCWKTAHKVQRAMHG